MPLNVVLAGALVVAVVASELMYHYKIFGAISLSTLRSKSEVYFSQDKLLLARNRGGDRARRL